MDYYTRKPRRVPRGGGKILQSFGNPTDFIIGCDDYNTNINLKQDGFPVFPGGFREKSEKNLLRVLNKTEKRVK
ncbi:MAG: hypothetical protein IJK97_02600 [Thermoguttaceae bacterium]|nr:hypothetical protein [Thermoguttaceae bacterium]